MIFRFCLCAALFLLEGCSSWRLAPTIVKNDPIEISTPFISNDEDGMLTSAVVQALSQQPGFRITEGGRYKLTIEFLGKKDDKLGFRYDPEKLKKNKKDLILSECREKALAKVTVIDQYSNTPIIGPAYILGSIEYDHQENSVNNNINHFSLGQLSDIDTAEDVLYIPLYRTLASKIALYLQNNQDFISSNDPKTISDSQS